MNMTFCLPKGHALGSFDVELPTPPAVGQKVRFDGRVFIVAEVIWDLTIVPHWVLVWLA